MGGALCVVVRLYTEANCPFFDNDPTFHNFFHFYFMYMGALSASMPTYLVCAVHEEARSVCWIPWDWITDGCGPPHGH